MADTKHTHHTYYPKESAGRIMTVRVPVIKESTTIGEVEKMLIEKINDFETINYVYVVDSDNVLIGVVSIKEMFRQPKHTPVSDVMEKDVKHVRSHSDQERAASLALKYNLKAVPVVGKGDVLLGVVQSDTVMQVLHEEHSEDDLYKEGVEALGSIVNIVHARAYVLLKARLPWLIVGLGGGFIAALVVGYFEGILAEELALVLFIPVMVYMSDAVGGQTQALFIRALAVDTTFSYSTYFVREMITGFFLALVLGPLLGLVAWVWLMSTIVPIILALSLSIAIVSSVFISLCIPMLLEKYKKDPAVGSGPFATIIIDITSILVYFAVAYVLLGMYV